MRLLLDAHTFLWLVLKDSQLAPWRTLLSPTQRMTSLSVRQHATDNRIWQKPDGEPRNKQAGEETMIQSRPRKRCKLATPSIRSGFIVWPWSNGFAPNHLLRLTHLRRSRPRAARSETRERDPRSSGGWVDACDSEDDHAAE